MDIAYQCPYEGGTAVFRARAILDGVAEIDFDDELLCGQDGGQQLIMPPSTGLEMHSSVTVYPNPAKKTVTLKFSEEVARGEKIGIINMYGQWIQTHDLPEGEMTFSFEVSNIPPGFYFLKITDNGRESSTVKLIINQ